MGSAAAWPFAARGQQADIVRRVGVLWAGDKDDPTIRAFTDTFKQGLADLGWVEGRNLQMEIRWLANDVGRMRVLARELIDLQPDAILAMSTPVTAAIQRETQTIPIIFTIVSDPVGDGFVTSLPHPGGNITGFVNFEASFGGKWLELLTQIAPTVTRVAAIFDPDTAPRHGSYFLPSFDAAAGSFNVKPIAAPVRSDDEIESVITSLGWQAGGGLVVMPDAFTLAHRVYIASLAARSKVPAVYPTSSYVRSGGLLCFGVKPGDIVRRAAAYVDRILRGAKPTELPVQLPTKFEMVLNAKTAKALGLAVPPSILLRADEVIE
jgi:putative ABC transport system substrate-binding protein